jgi:hypothetical protein
MRFVVDILDTALRGGPEYAPILATYEIEAQNNGEAERLGLTRFMNSKPLGSYGTLQARVRPN